MFTHEKVRECGEWYAIVQRLGGEQSSDDVILASGQRDESNNHVRLKRRRMFSRLLIRLLFGGAGLFVLEKRALEIKRRIFHYDSPTLHAIRG